MFCQQKALSDGAAETACTMVAPAQLMGNRTRKSLVLPGSGQGAERSGWREELNRDRSKESMGCILAAES